MARILVILSLFFLYSCYKAIQLVPDLPIIMILICLIFFSMIGGAMIISRRQSQAFESIWFISLSWLGTLFIGFWGTFGLISLPIDFVTLLYYVFNSGESLLSQQSYFAIFYLALAMVGIGFLMAVRGPKVVHTEIPSKDLPTDLQNLKIAQISDLHIGPTIRTGYVKKVVEKINLLTPDIVIITGDLVDAQTKSVRKHLQPLNELKTKYGVFYVSGNHEYYWEIQSLLVELDSLGIQNLLNSNKVIKINNSKLLVAGIPDPMGSQMSESHRPNLEKARSTSEKTDYNILLAHRPDPYKQAAELGFNLQFSGHTHAGQFFPFSLVIPLVHRYYRGLYNTGKMWLYVNPGTGYWGPANRFAIAAEITLATLVRTKT